MKISALREDLRKRLEERLGRPVRLALHANRRVMLSFRWGDDHVSLRLHHMFLTAGARELDVIARFAHSRDDASRAALQRYIDRFRHLVGVALPERDPAQGEVYDLRRLFLQLNRRWFGGRVSAHLEWGRRARRERKRTIRLGYFDESSRRIVVHPALDAADVPRFVVEWILFHEMLHADLGFRERGGRSIAHGREFRERERAFPHHVRAALWEEENLERLLRA